MPALQAFTTPSPLSFERIKPGCWSGAYQCAPSMHPRQTHRAVELQGLGVTLLHHMPVLQAFTTPSPLSFEPGCWSGAYQWASHQTHALNWVCLRHHF